MQQPKDKRRIRLSSSLITFNLIKDGEDGEPGKDGEDGKMGPSIYSAGEWDINTDYIGSDTLRPYVFYKGEYYLLNIEGILEAGGLDPMTDVAQQKGNWLLFDKFKAIYTEIILADNAILGSFIFNKDFFISQWGYHSNGEQSNEYHLFDPYNDIWTPNFSLNAKEGIVKVTKGEIGMFTIENNDFIGTDKEGETLIRFTADKIGNWLNNQHITIKDSVDLRYNVQLGNQTPGPQNITESYTITRYLKITQEDTLITIGGRQYYPFTGAFWHSFEDDTKKPLQGSIMWKVTQVYAHNGTPLDFTAEGATIKFRSLKAGSYTIKAVLGVTSTVPGRGSMVAPVPMGYLYNQYSYYKEDVPNTVIGSDGIVSKYRKDDYFQFQSNKGFEVVQTDKGLKIDNSGIYMMDEAKWQQVHLVPKAIDVSPANNRTMVNNCSFYYATNVTTITTFLPYNPYPGQVIYVARTNSGLTVNGNSKQIDRKGNLTNEVDIGQKGQIMLFIYNGRNWNCGYLGY